MWDHVANLPVAFRSEARLEIDRGKIETGRYFWSRRVEETVRGFEDALVLNLALTSRPDHTKVDRIEAPGTVATGDAGRLLVMMPGAPYHISAPSGAFRSFHCVLHCARFEELNGAAIDWASLSELGGEMRPGTKIEHLVMELHDELTHERIGRTAAIEAYVSALCVELLRRFRQGRPSRPDLHAGGLAAWRMRLLLERVQADRTAPSVGELAELCGLTTRQLSRAFKAETGMTIGRYVDEATMERAHRMLTSSEQPIAQIARTLGFAGPDSFAQAYRRMTGFPPSRSRRR